MMNQTITHQLNHRSIREFTDEPVKPEDLKLVLEVANHTATSTGMQSAAMIRVTDMAKKQALSEICQQPYVARFPELIIFIVDVYRNARIAEDNGYQFESERDMDRFFQGWTDACLMAQNATNAIESLGMGAVFLGSILNDSAATIQVLKLPKLTFPVLGVGFGWPNQNPQLKPRLPLDLRVFENEYKILADYKEAVREYDEEMQTYYDLREANRRVDSFTLQVIKKLQNPSEKRAKILQVVRDQGFDLKV